MSLNFDRPKDILMRFYVPSIVDPLTRLIYPQYDLELNRIISINEFVNGILDHMTEVYLKQSTIIYPVFDDFREDEISYKISFVAINKIHKYVCGNVDGSCVHVAYACNKMEGFNIPNPNSIKEIIFTKVDPYTKEITHEDMDMPEKFNNENGNMLFRLLLIIAQCKQMYIMGDEGDDD